MRHAPPPVDALPNSMPRTTSFLGKPIQQHIPVAPPRKSSKRFSWIILVAGPLIVLGAAASLLMQSALQQNVSAVSVVQAQEARVLADTNPCPAGSTWQSPSNTCEDNKTHIRTQAPSSQAINGTTSQSANPCAYTGALKDSFNPNIVFPLLPSSILSSDGNGCSPPFWNLSIVAILAYKIITLLDWLAAVLAVILTVYAGLLYISGFANEKNVDLAKKILSAAYTGLLIVIFARVILYSPIQLLGNKEQSIETLKNSTSNILGN